MPFDKITYKRKVEELLKKKKVSVSDEKIEEHVKSSMKKKLRPFECVNKVITKETGTRQKNLEKAEHNFELLLEAACDVSNMDKEFAKEHRDDQDWIDLRGLVAYIAFTDLNISPQRIVSDGMGMANSSMVYHASLRGRKLIDNRTIYNERYHSILEAINDELK